MVKIQKTKTWTFSLTLAVAIIGATLFGGFYGNRLFGSPIQSDVQKRLNTDVESFAATVGAAT